MSENELKNLRKTIEADFGISALALTDIFIEAFSRGMRDDIIQNRDRFDAQGSTARNAQARVASAMKKLIEESDEVVYYSTTHQIYYLDKNVETLFVNRSPLGDLIYEVMEIMHSLKPSKLVKTNGRYLTRERYDQSLESMIYSVAYAS